MSSIVIRLYRRGKVVREYNTGDPRPLNGGIRRHYERLAGGHMEADTRTDYKIRPATSEGCPLNYVLTGDEWDEVQVYQQR